jgi:hypothetical protein
MLDAPRAIDCPRCHQQCGWCSDPRWMHGQLAMPNDRKRRHCKIEAMAPEGGDCPMCGGSRKVMARTEYWRIGEEEA